MGARAVIVLASSWKAAATMPNILPFLPDQSAFAPEAVRAMTQAFDEVCQELGVSRDNKSRETIAVRIIELAQRGQLDVSRLRDRVLREANGGSELADPLQRWRAVR